VKLIFEYFLQGVRYDLHDPYLGDLTVTTLRLGSEATVIAMILGLPAACAIGLGRSRISRRSLVIANAGLGLPSVAVGVYFVLLVPGSATAPWGGPWLDGLSGMVAAQIVLSLPIIVAVSAVAIRGLPDGLIDQSVAFGASGWRLWLFALREAKLGVITAVIFAVGAAFGEVGAVTLIAGISPTTTTLASQVILDAQGTDFPGAVGHTIVLLGLMLILGLILLMVQRSGTRSRRRAPISTSPLVEEVA
jgi:tungstate transport system permease protein